MLTQCQHCKKTYSTDVAILCQPHKERFCSHCEEMLGKLKRLGDDFLILGQHKRTLQKESFDAWKLGVWICLAILGVQIYCFEKEHLAQNNTTRVWLQTLCKTLHCTLPTYKNSDDFEVMFGHLEQIKQQHYLFKAVISNQGKFRQQAPNIKLTLLSFSGKSFAQRVFTPKNYQTNRKAAFVAPSKTLEISMKIAKPKQAVGGYSFELI
jgi:hypothetical protein